MSVIRNVATGLVGAFVGAMLVLLWWHVHAKRYHSACECAR